MPLSPLDFFIRATDALVKFEANFTSLREEELDIYSLDVQAAEARELWSKVKEMFDQCLTYLQTSEDAESEDITSAESKYDVAYRAYVNVIASINRKLDQLRTLQKNSNPSLIQSLNSTQQSQRSNSHVSYGTVS